MEDHLPHAGRKFYQLDTSDTRPADKSLPQSSAADLLKYVDDNIIGKDKVFSGPFGLRKVTYCDYIASGRSVRFIEEYIQQEVLPEYGNTHTTTTVTSLQTTLFRHEARDIMRNAVNASEHDAVIFVGSGSTAAVHKLIHALNLKQPPVVFVSPFEHHSNLLPWRELGATVVRVTETQDGQVDLHHLEAELQKWQGSSQQLIGAFCAASNITGILVDVDTVSIMLHRYGALAFWDYATAAPYMKIDMNPVAVTSGNHALAYKDAVYFSCHKFVGGVQTPGVLVAKKVLFKNSTPLCTGGGSVFFVRRDAHRYLQEVEMREEGGTPAIVESVRAGLIMQLKQAVTPELIMQREHQFCKRALESWSGEPNLVILGSKTAPRLPVFSFLIRHPETGSFLHHNYVSAILNDVFGIQTRGGCACAGPYAEDLLGINEDLAKQFEDLLVEDSRLDRVHLRRYNEYSEREIIRPGFSRLNFPYFMDDEDVQFIIDALIMTARYAWKLLPQYTFNPETGEWRHYNHQVFKDRKWLGHVSYRMGRMSYKEAPCPAKGPLPSNHKDCLKKAAEILHKAERLKVHVGDQTSLFDGTAGQLRWFLLPSEALLWLHNPGEAGDKPKHPPVFEPTTYPRTEPSVRKGVLSPSRDNRHDSVDPNPDTLADLFEDGMMQSLDSGFNGLQINGESGSVVNAQGSPELGSISVSTHLNERSVASDSSHTNKIPQGDVNNSFGMETKLQDSQVPSVLKNKDANLKTAANTNIDVAVVEISKNENEAKSSVTVHASESETKTHSLTDPSGAVDAKTKPMCNSGTCTTEACGINNVCCGEGESTVPVSATDTTSDTPAGPACTSGACKTGMCGVGYSSSSDMKAEGSTSSAETGWKWHVPPKYIFRPTVQALEDYGMIEDGDRLLVCLSGGKDSLSLLHTMKQYQFYAARKGIKFEFGAVTVDPQTSAYDPRPLIQYLKHLQTPYFYEEQPIMEAAESLPYECASICSFCSRMKRGRIYTCARREGYNVLALGQHLDDQAESFLMSLFHNGILRTMKASYTVNQGDLRVIRPFVYVREKDLRQFAEQNKLPVIAENCPACFEAPKERHRMKQLLAAQEVLFPRLFHTLLSAMKPIMAIDRTGVNVKSLLTLGQQMLEQADSQNDTKQANNIADLNIDL